MNRNKSKYLSGILLSTVIWSCAALEKSPNNLYRYKDLFNGASAVILNFDNGYIYTDDVGRKLYLCSNEEFYCFHSIGISFAVPKDGFESRKKWSHNFRNYINEGIITSSVWGVYRNQHLISMAIDELKYLFLYSEKFGLSSIRIETAEHKIGRIFIVDRKFGFPKREE